MKRDEWIFTVSLASLAALAFALPIAMLRMY
jgi:hypothetical protein